MTVNTIVTQPTRSAQGSGEAAKARRMERLGALDAERMYLTLAFLAGYQPRVFDAALDATEPCADDEPDPSLEPEPFCTVCGGNAGIFWLLGEKWQHFRPSAGHESGPKVYDPGHAPVIGWRVAGNEVPTLPVIRSRDLADADSFCPPEHWRAERIAALHCHSTFPSTLASVADGGRMAKHGDARSTLLRLVGMTVAVSAE